MASIRKRGETFTITAYMGYDSQGKQIKKTTTYRPPENVTAGKAEKLARAFAATWEEKIKGYAALDENRTFAELVHWYYESVAPLQLKPNILIDNQTMINTYVMPTLARKKLKEITPSMLDALFSDMMRNGRTKDTYRLKEGVTLPKGAKTRRQPLRDRQRHGAFPQHRQQAFVRAQHRTGQRGKDRRLLGQAILRYV